METLKRVLKEVNFFQIIDVAINSNGNVYVASKKAIHAINMSTKEVTTISGGASYPGDGTGATAEQVLH